jgi:hypothetical protein
LGSTIPALANVANSLPEKDPGDSAIAECLHPVEHVLRSAGGVRGSGKDERKPGTFVIFREEDLEGIPEVVAGRREGPDIDFPPLARTDGGDDPSCDGTDVGGISSRGREGKLVSPDGDRKHPRGVQYLIGKVDRDTSRCLSPRQ